MKPQGRPPSDPCVTDRAGASGEISSQARWDVGGGPERASEYAQGVRQRRKKKGLGTRARRRGRYVHGRRLVPRGRVHGWQATCLQSQGIAWVCSGGCLLTRLVSSLAWGGHMVCHAAASQRFLTAAPVACKGN